MTSTQDNELARTIARRAETARLEHDFLTSVSLFGEALTILQDPSEKLRRWCLAHRGAALAGLGAFSTGQEDLDRAEKLFSPAEKETSAAYTWLLAQQGELHRLAATQEFTPARNLDRYCEEIASSLRFFQQALDRDPQNPWVCIHYACTATVAYWYGFSNESWRKPLEHPDFPERQTIRELFDRGLSARSDDWWGKTFQVIYYVVEYPTDFGPVERCKDGTAGWVKNMQRWWCNYELAMDYAKGLEGMGMRRYAALAGQAIATAYGLAWHDAVTHNLGALPDLSSEAQELLDQAIDSRAAYLDKALVGGLELMKYSPEDLFANLVVGSVLRSRAQGEDKPERLEAAAYLSTLRRLSVIQSFITSMLFRSTEAWKIQDGLSAEERREFDGMHDRNTQIWKILSNQAEQNELTASAELRAAPRPTMGLEQEVLRNLLFPR